MSKSERCQHFRVWPHLCTLHISNQMSLTSSRIRQRRRTNRLDPKCFNKKRNISFPFQPDAVYEKKSCDKPLTLGSTAQCCRLFVSLWVCFSSHKSGWRRLNDLPASDKPPAGSVHLTQNGTKGCLCTTVAPSFVPAHQTSVCVTVASCGVFPDYWRLNPPPLTLFPHFLLHEYTLDLSVFRCELNMSETQRRTGAEVLFSIYPNLRLLN